jgi:hypothetical protein
VADSTTLHVYELLKAADRQAVNGVLYNGDTTLQKLGDRLLVDTREQLRPLSAAN